MAIARDSILGEQVRSAGSTFSYNFTNVAGNYLIIGVVVEFNDMVNISYGGVAMTRLAQVLATAGGRDIVLYGLANPATGTNSVDAVNMNAAGNFTRFFTASYSGVSLTSNPEVSTYERADAVTTLTGTVTILSDNDWLIGFGTNENSSLAAGSNTSLVTSTTTYGLIDTNAAQTPVGSYSMTVTGAAGANGSAIIVAAFKPSTDIAYEGVGNSGDITAASSYSGSASWSGLNKCLSIDVSMLGAGVTVTSMTYGGANCTFIGSKSTVTSLGSVECWRIIESDSGAPASGSNTLIITLSSSIEFIVEWTSYSGVNQTTPTEAFNSAQATNAGSATDASVVITTVADFSWVHATVVANDTAITAGNTSRNNIPGILGSGGNEDSGVALSPGNKTMSYTGMGITTTWAIAGYALRPVSAPNLAKSNLSTPTAFLTSTI